MPQPTPHTRSSDQISLFFVASSASFDDTVRNCTFEEAQLWEAPVYFSPVPEV